MKESREGVKEGKLKHGKELDFIFSLPDHLYIRSPSRHPFSTRRSRW